MNSLTCPSPAAPDCETLIGRAQIVQQVREGDARGMADLYEFISIGLRPYLARQLQSQDCRDKIHNIFVDVVIAIQRGQLRDPERLMGFARTIARRKVSGYICAAVFDRRNQVDIQSIFWLASPQASAESEMIFQEQRDLVRWTLAQLSDREREILSRFYMQEQSQQQICHEMGLTHTQYRLLKWRSKVRFGELSRKEIGSRHRRSLCADQPR